MDIRTEEVENGIIDLEMHEEHERIITELLDNIYSIVKKVVDSNKKSEDISEKIIEEMMICFLEVIEGNREEEKLSIAEKSRKLQIIEEARHEKAMRDYRKMKHEQKVDSEKQAEFNRKKALGTFETDETKEVDILEETKRIAASKK